MKISNLKARVTKRLNSGNCLCCLGSFRKCCSSIIWLFKHLFPPLVFPAASQVTPALVQIKYLSGWLSHYRDYHKPLLQSDKELPEMTDTLKELIVHTLPTPVYVISKSNQHSNLPQTIQDAAPKQRIGILCFVHAILCLRSEIS